MLTFNSPVHSNANYFMQLQEGLLLDSDSKHSEKTFSRFVPASAAVPVTKSPFTLIDSFNTSCPVIVSSISKRLHHFSYIKQPQLPIPPHSTINEHFSSMPRALVSTPQQWWIKGQSTKRLPFEYNDARTLQAPLVSSNSLRHNFRKTSKELAKYQNSHRLPCIFETNRFSSAVYSIPALAFFSPTPQQAFFSFSTAAA